MSSATRRRSGRLSVSTPRARRLLAAASLIALSIVGCDWIQPPEPPPPADVLYDVRSGVAVAAGWLSLSHGVGEVVTVVPLREGVIARAVTTGGVTRVAWVGPARVGSHVQIGFEVDADLWSSPQVTEAAAYFDSSEPVSEGAISISPAESSAAQLAWAPLASLSLPESDDDEITPAFADFRLGDVNASGELGILDALLLDELTRGATSDVRQRYLADLDGDYSIDADDLAMLLEKLTDPNVPARLVVKPRSLPFVRLDASNPELPAFLLLGNGGNAALSGVDWSDPGVDHSVNWPIAGQSGVFSLGEPANGSWLPNVMTVAGPGGSWDVRLGHLVILVAGQSNAAGRGLNLAGWPETTQNDPNVRMLGNDYRWRNAREPLDDGQGQLDFVSYDSTVQYSFGTRLGNLLNEALGFTTYLIPAAKGGSCLTHCGEPPGDTGKWELTGDALNRDSLLGSANFRAQVAVGHQSNPADGNEFAAESGPVNVVVWYQGESEDESLERSQYKQSTLNVFNSFGLQQFGASAAARVIMVQLASNLNEGDSLTQNDIAERQRQLERDHPNIAMVVAHDLPRSDHVHVSASGQRVLAERIALAIREHVFGEDVDGTGPRPVDLSASGNQVRIQADRPLATGTLDANMFTVFDGAPNGTLEDPSNYGQNTIAITKAEVLPEDPTTIVLTLGALPESTPFVRYMPPPGRSHVPSTWTTIAPDMARDAVSGLPLPQFGPRPGF